MAQTAVDVVVRVKDLAALDRLKKSLAGVEGATLKGERGIKRFETSLAKLGRTLAGLAVGDQLRRAFGAAAEFSGTEQRINNVTKKYQQFAGIQRSAAEAAKTFAVSQQQALSDLGDLASRLGSSGASLKDLENIYGGFNTLLLENAVGAQQAAAAQLQLNQALGSGRLAGEEFNAINEATPQLLDEVAKILGVARGELKKLASDGKISSQVLIQALTNIKTQGADALAASLDTPAGKLRQFDAAVKNFQVTIGNELLPVITPLIQQLTSLLKVFSELPGPVKAAAVGVTAVAAAAVLLAPGITAVVGGLKAAAAGLLALGAGAGASTAALSLTTKALLVMKGVLLTMPWVAAAAGAIALGAAIYKLANRGKAVEEQYNKQTDALKSFNDINNRANKAMKENSLTAINSVIAALKNEIIERIANNEEIEQQIRLMERLQQAKKGAKDDTPSGGRSGSQFKPATALERLNSRRAIQLEVDTAGLENAKRISDAFYDAQLKLVDLQAQRARQSGNVNALLQAELQKAQLIYQQTISQVQQEVARAQLKVKQVELATSELKTELLLKQAKGEAIAQDYLAFQQQQASLKLAKEQVGVAQKLAKVQTLGARAVYQAQVEAARFQARNPQGRAGGGAGGGGLGQLNAAAANTAESVSVLGTATSQGAETSARLAQRLAEIGKTGVFSRQQASAILAAHNSAASNLKGAAGSLKGAASSLKSASGGGRPGLGTSNLAINALAKQIRGGSPSGGFGARQRDYIRALNAQTDMLRRIGTKNAFYTYRSQSRELQSLGYNPPSNPYRNYRTKVFRPLFGAGPYAEGGFVDKPTQATIGERGESEYVIPESKMSSAMKRYARGARGESVTEGPNEVGGNSGKQSKAVVNVSTGPVMRMNNKDYVTVNDMNSALGSVVSAMSSSDGNYSSSALLG